MDLKSGYPFWAIKNGLMYAFPRLRDTVHCDVAVIGAGITGALIADELAKHGHKVTVLEQRDVAWGSTSASTALLQYEIDVHMIDLAKRYGEHDAVLAYLTCATSVEMLGELARGLGDVDFATMSSLYYASYGRHAPILRDEFDLRRRHGFDVELIEREPGRELFSLDAPVSILSHQAARVDPYRMTYRLLKRLQQNGHGVFDRTTVVGIVNNGEKVLLKAVDGAEVWANHVVVAAGYAGERWLKRRVARNRSSYAFITDPIDEHVLGALKTTIMWESARPYLYVRSTGDNRLLIGGEDDAFDIPSKRDARVHKKADLLGKKVKKIWPHLPLSPAFAWAGTFAETKDGLPFFGPHKQYGPRVLFALAYGGNGITYSMLGAGLLRALIERRDHPLADLLSFDRLTR
jgi:glycine/D-amino acid oxidase-like deaminating enzyme